MFWHDFILSIGRRPLLQRTSLCVVTISSYTPQSAATAAIKQPEMKLIKQSDIISSISSVMLVVLDDYTVHSAYVMSDDVVIKTYIYDSIAIRAPAATDRPLLRGVRQWLLLFPFLFIPVESFPFPFPFPVQHLIPIPIFPDNSIPIPSHSHSHRQQYLEYFNAD